MSEPKTSEPKMVTTAVIISLVAGILIILGGLYTTAILVFSFVTTDEIELRYWSFPSLASLQDPWSDSLARYSASSALHLH